MRYKSGRYGNGAPFQNYKLREYFGWPSKFTPDFTFAGTIEGLQIRVLSYAEAKAKHPRSSKPRRTEARCSVCGAWVCAGHIGQHKAAHFPNEPHRAEHRPEYSRTDLTEFR